MKTYTNPREAFGEMKRLNKLVGRPDYTVVTTVDGEYRIMQFSHDRAFMVWKIHFTQRWAEMAARRIQRTARRARA